MKNTKKCEVCGKELPLSDFSKSYKNRCRKCVAEMVRSERKQKMDNEKSGMVKAIVKSTGEIVMVKHCHEPITTRTAFYETEDGRKFPMFTLEFEKDIDWEQRRYDMTKDFTAALLGRLNYDPLTANLNCCCSDVGPVNPYMYIVGIAVSVSDAVIEKLKKGGNTKDDGKAENLRV